MKFLRYQLLSIVLLFSVLGSDCAPNTFSVLSWNVLGPKAMDVDKFFPGVAQKNRLQDIAHVINSFNPDIICLQEVSEYTSNDFKFRKALNSKYKKAAYGSKGKFGGVMVFYN